MNNSMKNLTYVVTEDHYFLSHRLPMARAAMRAGYEVSLITNISDEENAGKIAAEGIDIIPLSLERRSLNPFKAAVHLLRLSQIFNRLNPDVLHLIGMKPLLLGNLAALRIPRAQVVSAFAGLGYLFTSDAPKPRMIRGMIRPFLAATLNRRSNHILLQNRDDLKTLTDSRFLKRRDHVTIIPGSGVDLKAHPFHELPQADSPFICLFAARMLAIKGLAPLKDAFALLEKTHPHIHLWLCGRPDDANPASWSEADLQDWAQAPNVTYQGYCPDINAMLARAHCAVLPSLGGEGVPKALLDAAAAGRPLVATDVPGCRDVVKPGVNGTLVPAGDAATLAKAIAGISEDKDALKEMGRAARNMIEKGGFSADSVSQQTETFYRGLIAGGG